MYKCFDYGHPKTKCSNPTCCSNCSQSHETESGKCPNAPFCKNCEQAHSPKDKKCPVYLKENAIIHLKTDKNCTYSEAKEIYDRENSAVTYASKVQERLQQARNESVKDDEIKKLKIEIENLKVIAKEIVTIKLENVRLREKYKAKLEENFILSKQHNEQLAKPENTNPSPKTPDATPKGIIKRPLSQTLSNPIQPPDKKLATAENETDANNFTMDNLDENGVLADEDMLDRDL